MSRSRSPRHFSIALLLIAASAGAVVSGALAQNSQAPRAVPVQPNAGAGTGAAQPASPTATGDPRGTAVPVSGPAVASGKKSLFKGVVQDDKLQPLAGATVNVVSAVRDEAAGGMDNPSRPPRGGRFGMGALTGGSRADESTESGPFFTAKSDASGAFAIEADGDGPFNMRVDAAGFAPTFVDGVKGSGSVSTVYMQHGAAASGIVADLATGAPLPDAEVFAALQNDHGFRDADDPRRFAASVRTGKNGGFSFSNLLPSYYQISVQATGRAAFSQSDKPVGDSATPPMILYLSPGYDVSGRVIDPAGKPIAKIAVSARGSDRNPMAFLRMRGGRGSLTARTDKDGRFTLRGLSVETKYSLEADSKQFAPASVEVQTPRPGTNVSGVEIRFERGSVVRAKLVDAEQKPVTTNVSATIAYRDPKTRRRLRTVERPAGEIHVAPTGELTLDRLPTGTATISISAEGFKDAERKDIPIGRDAKAADLGTLTFDRGKSITGRVIDAGGKPVASAKVSASAWSPGRSFQSAESKSDAAGKFVLGGLDEADNFTVQASAKGYAGASESNVATGKEPVELTLQRAGSIKGRVVIGDPPRPITNFSLEATAKEAAGGMMMGMFRPRGETRRFTDSRGQFALEALTPGIYTVTCKADGLQDLVRDGVEVRGGEATEVGDFTLVAGGTIRGHVLSKPEGLPVAAAAVRVKSSGLFDFRNMGAQAGANSVVTDLAGQFELRGLPSGATTILIEPENFAKAEMAGINVEAGSVTDDVVVNVGKGGRVEGRVLGDDGRPKAGSLVSVVGGVADFSARLTGTTDENGHYAIDNVAPGSCRVMNLPFAGGSEEDDSAPAGGGRGAIGFDTVTVVVKDGETSTVNFGEKKIKISGAVKRKDGTTSGLMVMFAPPGGTRGRMGMKSATTDDTGHYELTLTEPGDYQIYVGESGRLGGTGITVSVPDKPEFAYDIALPEGRITGRVIDSKTGGAIKDAKVDASPAEPKDPSAAGGRRGSGGRASTGADGSFVIKDMAAGTYDITISHEGYGSERREGVEVKGSDETTIDQLLGPATPFTVRVMAPSGSSVPGALVMVTQNGAALSEVTGMTGDDGSLALKVLKSGTYSFLALTRDFAPGIASTISIGGESDPDSAVVTLAQGGSAKVLVQDSLKKPLADVQIKVRNTDDPDLDVAVRNLTSMQSRSKSTADDGTYTLEHLPAGKYEVSATKGDKTLTKSLTVEEGAKASLTVTME